MKRTVGIIRGMAALGIAVYVTTQLFAQAPPPAAPVAPAQPRPLQTRIGIVNMVVILKDYKKFQTIEQPIREKSKFYEQKLEGYRQELNKMKMDYNQPSTTQAMKEAIDKRAREVTQKAQGEEEDAKKELAKMQGEAAVQIYKEVKSAVDRFALQYGFEAVFFYNDAVTESDLVHPANVQRKLMQPACLMPMFITPGMDISKAIVDNLNASYAPTAAAPGTPGMVPQPPR